MICRLVQRGMFIGIGFIGIGLQLTAAGVRPDTAPVGYRVTRYTTEQGLPQNRIRALLQTRDGYLWIGTLAGLVRFDGVRFKVFDMDNTPEMLNDAIDALAEDRQDGSLWVNTGNSLWRYHQHRFERFNEQQGFPIRMVLCGPHAKEVFGIPRATAAWSAFRIIQPKPGNSPSNRF
jgi:ligand-binding sensor domain-containing protein